MKARPIGITILAFLFALNVAVYSVFALLAVFNHGALVAVLHTLSPSGAGPETIHSSMGRLQPIYYSGMAILTCAMAVGFWKLQNWARIVMLALIALSLLLMTTEVRPLLAAPTARAMILTLVRIALSVFWLWYLLRRPVRDVFRREVPAAFVRGLSVGVFFLFVLRPAQAQNDVADIVLVNANVFTAFHAHLHAEAIAIKGERILAVEERGDHFASWSEDEED